MIEVNNDNISLTKDLVLTCKILDKEYIYKLSGHGYEPRIYFTNENINLTFSLGSAPWFPEGKLDTKENWERFARECQQEIIKFLITRESDYEIRNQLRLLLYDYDWNDVKDRIIDTIGAYWQCGIAKGTIESHMMYFGYTCSCNRNENFFIIYEINEGLYTKIKSEYSDYLGSTHKYVTVPNDIENEIAVLFKKFGTVIYEGWDCL